MIINVKEKKELPLAAPFCSNLNNDWFLSVVSRGYRLIGTLRIAKNIDIQNAYPVCRWKDNIAATGTIMLPHPML
jgi:hypothetical protein